MVTNASRSYRIWLTGATSLQTWSSAVDSIARMAEFPFLYWGRSPRDWHEGANHGHAFQIRFAAELTAAQRLAVADAFRAAVDGKENACAVEAFGSEWAWSGAWATFRVGEADRGFAGCMDAMARVLERLH